MCHFNMNGYEWRVIRVDPYDSRLIDRSGILTVATTDPYDQAIYISSDIYGDFLKRVLIHELGHAAMFSYYLVDDIHEMVEPEYWFDAEEWTCNFMADYGMKIFQILKDLHFE